MTQPTASLPQIPGFRCERLLGRGAFGRVFLAREEGGLERPVALKVFAAEHCAAYTRELGAMRAIEELRRRERAAQITQALGTGEHAGCGWIALEFLEGGTLRDRIRAEGPLSAEAAVAALRDVALALRLLHGEGLSHGDLKPSNLLLGKDGRVRLGDFGLSRGAGLEETAGGSPGFVAPEILSGRRLASAELALADIYGWGATLAYLLTGATMDPGEPDVFALDRAGVPRPLQDLIVDCMARDPAERVASVEQVLEALGKPEMPGKPDPRAAGAGPPPPPGPRSGRRLFALAAAPLLLLAAWGVASRLRDPVAVQEAQAVECLRRLNAAQERFRAEDLDGNGLADYGTLGQLREAGLLEGALGEGIVGGYSFHCEPADLRSDSANPDYFDADGDGDMTTHRNATAADARHAFGSVAHPLVAGRMGRRVFLSGPTGRIHALSPDLSRREVTRRVQSDQVAIGLFAGSGIPKWLDLDPVSPGSLEALVAKYPEWLSYEVWD